MVSTVQSRPSHYETLGLTPAASTEEILQAFAREMSMFRVRPMAAVAQISIAYETLRNPAKRRAYDASLGLESVTEPQTPPVPPARQDEPRFIGAAEETLPEQRLGSFIAESLREPVRSDEVSSGPKPERALRPEAEAKPRPQAEAKPGVDLHLADLLAARRAVEDASTDSGERSPAWKGPAMAAGAVVLAVGLAGAWLGWGGGNAGTSRQAAPDMAIALPAATPVDGIATGSPPQADSAEVPDETKARPNPPAAQTAVERIPPPPIAEEPQVEGSQIAEAQPAEKAVERAVPDASATVSVAAALSLSNAVVARTIRRIGYACGEVASSEPVEGEGAGVFKVTCTSGQSYRAAPVRGRYHFRRWDRP